MCVCGGGNPTRQPHAIILNQQNQAQEVKILNTKTTVLEYRCTLSPVMGMPSGRLLPCNSLSPAGVPDSPLLWFWFSVIRPTEDDTPESTACFTAPEWPFRMLSVQNALPSWHLPDMSELQETKQQLIKKLPTFQGTYTMFIATFMTAHHLSLSCTKLIPSTLYPEWSRFTWFLFKTATCLNPWGSLSGKAVETSVVKI